MAGRSAIETAPATDAASLRRIGDLMAILASAPKRCLGFATAKDNDMPPAILPDRVLQSPRRLGEELLAHEQKRAEAVFTARGIVLHAI